MPAKKLRKISTEELRAKLKLKQISTNAAFQDTHKRAAQALKEKGVDLGKARKHSAKVITAGALAGTLLIGSPDHKALPAPQSALEKIASFDNRVPVVSPRVSLLSAFSDVLPENPRPLTREEEKTLEKIIKETTGVNARATLEGEHLNTTYGKIGAEQHLRRYPGDRLEDHGEGEDLAEGMAPGLGAWGYFAPSKNELTPELAETEKWYAVVQTLYLSDWNTRQPHLKNWYKYRKVLIINTENGQAVVASIADSGPAAWTGKHFGGSPEVMNYLGGPRYKKGPVLIYFVDDPDNTVPLGPVEYNTVNIGSKLVSLTNE